MRSKKKHLDFEINLIPCIDLLSVCICFLLLTAVWLNVGSLNVKQAVGGQSAAETEKKPMLWVIFGANGDLSVDVQGSTLPATLQKLKIPGLNGQIQWSNIVKAITDIKTAQPNLVTALIQPKADSEYENIIQLLDEIKIVGLIDLGVAPLLGVEL
jgi:biopolymer transport protein TolR